MAAEAGLGEQSSRAPATDLLRRFGVNGASGGEVELGLSLGGCFGAEPEKNRLVRASSISGLSMYDDEGIVQPIVRTCSLPMESEEELRKRKGFQSLKPLEVKRRRLEKRESRTGAKRDSDRGAVDELSRLRSISRRSVGSQGSSGLSDFDCQLEHGSSSCKELITPPLSITLSLNQAHTVISIKDKQSKKILNEANAIISIEEDKQSKKKLNEANTIRFINEANTIRFIEEDMQSKKKLEIADKAIELVRSRMEGMPCVSARGNGPNGRMIQGLLYKYGNGMDVRIVCVCHGSFLTPAEFVKHAGGVDVAHPLRHIVVSRPPFAF